MATKYVSITVLYWVIRESENVKKFKIRDDFTALKMQCQHNEYFTTWLMHL